LSLEDIFVEADRLSRLEKEKYKVQTIPFYELTLEVGAYLAKKYNADCNVVKIGLAMMDIKLPEAQKLGMLKEHVNMSVKETEKLLKDIDIDDSVKMNIIKCVEQHHGVDDFYSIEAEICSNADCYIFIHPRGVFSYLSMLARRHNDIEKELEQVEYKMDEKIKCVTLDVVKEELLPYYTSFKKSLEQASKQWK